MIAKFTSYMHTLHAHARRHGGKRVVSVDFLGVHAGSLLRTTYFSMDEL